VSESTNKVFSDTKIDVPRILVRGTVNVDVENFTTYAYGTNSETIPQILFDRNHIVDVYIGTPNVSFIKVPFCLVDTSDNTNAGCAWFDLEDDGSNKLKINFNRFIGGGTSFTEIFHYAVYSTTYK